MSGIWEQRRLEGVEVFGEVRRSALGGNTWRGIALKSFLVILKPERWDMLSRRWVSHCVLCVQNDFFQTSLLIDLFKMCPGVFLRALSAPSRYHMFSGLVLPTWRYCDFLPEEWMELLQLDPRVTWAGLGWIWCHTTEVSSGNFVSSFTQRHIRLPSCPTHTSRALMRM